MMSKDLDTSIQPHRVRSHRFASLALGLAFTLTGACHHQGIPDDEGWDFAVPSDFSQVLTISPVNPVIVLEIGQPLPSQQFTATVGGLVVQPSKWETDRGELGSIDQHGIYNTVGGLGGKAIIKAHYNGMVGTTVVTVQYKVVQNGDNDACSKPIVIGIGGYGGVGGNGPGCAASASQLAALQTTPTADAALRWLYPYEATVFPRGLLAPLLMWDAATHNFDSLRLQMTSKNGTFVYDGTFAKPAGKPFVNLPIPQIAWDSMNYSSSGDDVVIKVTFGEGTKSVGPISITWHIAAATLKGIVYYNSYGTSRVINSGEPDFNGNPFGAGTLAILPGVWNPTLVAGIASSDRSGCRVCHSVTKDGSRLVTQRGDKYQTSRMVDLKSGNTETSILTGNSAFSAMYPTGAYYFSSSGGMINGDTASQLYSLPDGLLVGGVTGLPADLQAALPSFSPDGTQVVFNYWKGAGSDGRSLGVMSFDANQKKFGAISTIYTPTGGTAVWPSFIPTNTGVVFEVEQPGQFGFTWHGKQAGLSWVDVATKKAHTLDKLNGVGYLPTGPYHPDDSTLNYEPTVNPIPSGGYAWVVFTSRRMYGNVATQDPTLSDPRLYDWTTNITTKKLWVAAVDLSGKVLTDPSHPAFYLPAQELHAGNSRGFWTTEPCRADGGSCETGDECCGGYCHNSSEADAGAVVLQCSSKTPLCAQEFEKCTTDADCCIIDSAIDPSGQQQPTCINGYCSVPNPTPIL